MTDSDGMRQRIVPRAAEGAPGSDQQGETWPGLGELVVTGTTKFVKTKPAISALWVLGILLAIFANGLPVEEIQRMQYEQSIEKADHVTQMELREAYQKLRKSEDAYYSSKGWFFSCDDVCQRNWEKVERSRQRVDMVEAKREGLIHEARSAVGVFSTFGVGEVRRKFWDSWDDGKQFASRWTMYDAMFAMFSSRNRDDGLAEVIIGLLLRYLSNLTVGLCASTVFFIGSVVGIIQSFGPTMLTGIAFFLLVVCSSLAILASFFTVLYGTIGGATYLAMKHVAENPQLLEDMQNNQRNRQRRRVQYNHYD